MRAATVSVKWQHVNALRLQSSGLARISQPLCGSCAGPPAHE
jgi:hypothetical protein